jgi:glucose/arabinose dehydrogenase
VRPRFVVPSTTLVLLSLLAATLPAAATGRTTEPRAVPSLTVTSVVSGLNKPWDIAFTPDGTMLFTEKIGTINARAGGITDVLADPDDVLVAGEGGMMGIAVDPNFATNRRIYTCFLSRDSGRPDDVRVVRWRVADDYGSLSERADIVTGIDVNTTGSLGRHSGCRPRFGPDGYLWIGTGDAATGTNPQDPDSLAGKVLRVDADGDGAPGNAGPPFREEIYTYGHRNVQGIAFRPSDGKAYSVEHGTGCDDEINALEAGGNYGWDPTPPGGGPGYDESVPMTDLVQFPDAVEAVWSSGCPTIAPSGATFLSGPQWNDWDGAMAVAVLKDSELFVVRLDAAGTGVVGTSSHITDRGRLRTAVQGPTGDLFLAQDAFPGGILRVVPGCAGAPFSDVIGTNPFCADIAWLVLAEVAEGFDDGTFRPTLAVSRQAMAGFLHRLDGEPDPALTSPAFADVPPSNPFYDAIQWLAEEGIATGTPGPGGARFHPTQAVSRGAMAAFLHRYAGEPPLTPPSTPTFPDVSASHPFFAEVEWLAAADVVSGFGDGTYRPALAVSRQSMAAFLHRFVDA